MAGNWTDQNKVIPGVYINFKTNSPLSLTAGDRGIVVILEEVTSGVKGDMYKVTALENNLPEAADKTFANEALKGAKEVYVYNVGVTHTLADVQAALKNLSTFTFNVLVYPYSTAENCLAVTNWIGTMRDEEGVKVQGVIPNYIAGKEYIINPVQSIILEGGTELPIGAVACYVGGITAGANIYESNTGLKYIGAIDVKPRMTRTEMETAIKAGKYIFKVDNSQNVTSVYDINSLTSVTPEKNKTFTKNRAIRTFDGIGNDIVNIFESNYIGKINNNAEGRSLLRATLVEYFNALQRLNAIQNFEPEDVEVFEGIDKESVVINCNIQTVDSAEKIFLTVNLS